MTAVLILVPFLVVAGVFATFKFVRPHVYAWLNRRYEPLAHEPDVLAEHYATLPDWLKTATTPSPEGASTWHQP